MLLRVWSKIFILSVPTLSDKSAENQERVEDMAGTLYHIGDKCVLHNLSFAEVWRTWDQDKAEYLRCSIFHNMKQNRIEIQKRFFTRNDFPPFC